MNLWKHCGSDLSSLMKQGKAWTKQHVAITAVAAMALVSLVLLFTVTACMTPVVIEDGDTTRTVLTLNRKPQTILANAGIHLADDDIVTSSLDGPEKRICIERAFDVNITVNDGESTVVRLTGGTVSDALELAGVKSDKGTVITNASKNDLLSDGLTICVEQHDTIDRVETQKVPFVTVIRYTEDKPAGTRVVLQKGKNGTKTCHYTDYLQDGEVVRSELKSEELATEPVNQIVLSGTGPVAKDAEKVELDKNGAPKKYKQVLTGTACAYTANPGAVTATGTAPKVGTVAVNPKIIPYGSKLYIVSDDGYVYGYGVAEDTGGSALKNAIIADLYMDTIADCYAFGRRNVKVYILE